MKDSKISSAASGSRLPTPNLHQMKDSKKSKGVTQFVVDSLHQVKKGRHSRVGVLKWSRFRSAEQLKRHLSWYVPFNPNLSGEKISHLPQINWKCPPTFGPEPSWRVGCGNESQETDNQKCREKTVQEAVYPCLNDIPPSPFTDPSAESETYEDSRTPVVSLVPIEDLVKQLKFHAEVAKAAASMVVAAVEKGEQIDIDWLIKVIYDPEMVKKLIDGTLLPCTGRQKESNMPAPSHTHQLAGMQQQQQEVTLPITSTSRAVAIMSVPDARVMSPVAPMINTSMAEASWIRPPVASRQPDVEDLNKIISKYLGGGKPYTSQRHQAMLHETKEQKLPRSCIYFGSSRGCRNGSKCRFKHDTMIGNP